MNTPSIHKKLYLFYKDGFRNMKVGKTLWIIVLIKLFIMFVVLRTFFFPNFLKTNFPDDKSRANYVRTELIKKSL